MQVYKIVIQRLPGNPDQDVYVTARFDSEADAWDWARENWKAFGPHSRVQSVEQAVPSFAYFGST